MEAMAPPDVALERGDVATAVRGVVAEMATGGATGAAVASLLGPLAEGGQRDARVATLAVQLRDLEERARSQQMKASPPRRRGALPHRAADPTWLPLRGPTWSFLLLVVLVVLLPLPLLLPLLLLPPPPHPTPLHPTSHRGRTGRP